MSSAFTSYCRIHPSEYAYHSDRVYHDEDTSANCRNYPRGNAGSSIHPEHYIHCNGTQLRLTDSDIGSEQYTTSDYYRWTAGSGNRQLLFMFPTRVNMSTITLHYYSDNIRGLPRLRFWAVPDDFDVWDAPAASDSQYVEVAAVLPEEEQAGINNVSVSFKIVTMKMLLHKSTSTYSFALSEVEFFNDFCDRSQNITTISEDSKKSSDYMITTLHMTESDVTPINTSSGTSGNF